MNNSRSFQLWTARILPAFALMALAGGCHQPMGALTNQPAEGLAVTTASSVAARAVPVERTQPHRASSPVEIAAKDGRVTHGPLMFEDPFEEAPQDAGLACPSAGLLHWAQGPARFLTNLAFLPISAAATPPWVVMTSDGEPSRLVMGHYHDAQENNGAIRSSANDSD